MFILKKLIVPFVRPPGIFVAAVLLVAAVLAMRKRRKAAVAWMFLGVAMWLPATAPVEDLLYSGLMRNIPEAGATPLGDVIVLLGGGVEDRRRDTFGEPGVPGQHTNGRIITTARLHRRLQVPVIISGGRPFGETVSEAEVNARVLADLGVPPDRMILEQRSRDTRENATEVARICTANGYRRLLLVSSSFHLARARMMFASTGLAVVPVSDRSPGDTHRRYRWRDFLPASYERTSLYLHEYLGMFVYRFVD